MIGDNKPCYKDTKKFIINKKKAFYMGLLYGKLVIFGGWLWEFLF